MLIHNANITGSLTVNGSSVVLTNQTSSTMFVQGGNSFGTQAIIGTNDNQNLALETSGSIRMAILSGGNIGIGTTSPTQLLQVNGSNAGILVTGVVNTSGVRLSVREDGQDVQLISQGTGGGIRFLVNGSTEAARITSGGNVGIGVTPSAWRNIFNALQIGYTGAVYSIATATAVEQVNLASNYYQDSAGNELRIQAGFATRYQQASGEHRWSTAGTSTAGSGISFTQAMTLDASGRLAVGKTPSARRLELQQALGGNAAIVGLYDGGGSLASVVGLDPSANDLQIANTAGIRFYAGSTIGNIVTEPTNERMRITSGGNVGIGTTSPSSLLHINSATAGASILRIENTSGTFETTTAFLQLQFKALRGVTTTDRASIVVGRQAIGGSDADAFMAFYTNNGGGNNERMRLDASGNLGLGVTPSAWTWRAMQVNTTSIASTSTVGFLTANAFFDGSYKYIQNGAAQVLEINNANEFRWLTAPSGTAGNVISFTQAMTLDASGNLAIGSTTALGKLQISTSSGTTIFRSVVALGGTANPDNLAIKQDFISGVAANYLWSNSNYMLGVGRNGGTMPTTEADAIALSSFVVNSSGRVGIGTTNPTALLTLDSASEVRFRMNTGGTQQIIINHDQTSGIIRTESSTPLVLGTAGTERMRITSGGFVGIGTTSPAYRLSVQGSIGIEQSEEYLYFNSTYIVGNNSRGKIRAVGAGGGSGYGGDLRFSTRNPSNIWNEDAMVINSSGNVGIGTSSPSGRLDISSANDVYTNIVTSSNNTSAVLCLYNSTGVTDGAAIGYNVAMRFGTITGLNASGFTERMRITSGGNVGIGTTSPDYQFQIENVVQSTFASIVSVNTGTAGLLLGDTDSATIGRLEYDNAGNFMSFYANASERMRITSGGNVLIGATSNPMTGNSDASLMISSPNGNDSISVKSNSNGSNIVNLWQVGTSNATAIAFYKGNTQTAVGSIGITTSATSYNTSSDYRLKTDFKDFIGVDVVEAMKVYDYMWKADGSRSYGVLAHELQNILPYAVTGEKDGDVMQGVDYSKIVPILIKAIQELKAELDELKSTR